MLFSAEIGNLLKSEVVERSATHGQRKKSLQSGATCAMGAQYSVRGCFVAFTMRPYESAFGPQLLQIWTDLNQTWHKETVPQSNTASHIGRTLRHHAALQLFSLNVWPDLSPNSTAPFFSELDHKFVKQSPKPIFWLVNSIKLGFVSDVQLHRYQLLHAQTVPKIT